MLGMHVACDKELRKSVWIITFNFTVPFRGMWYHHNVLRLPKNRKKQTNKNYDAEGILSL